MNWVQSGLGFLLGISLMFGYHEIAISLIKSDDAATIQKQTAAITKLCKSAQQITSEVSHDYQSKLSHLNAELSDIKRVRAYCPVRVTGAGRGLDGSPSVNGYGAGNEVNGEALADFSGRAEKYRLQLNACQSFVIKERAMPQQSP